MMAFRVQRMTIQLGLDNVVVVVVVVMAVREGWFFTF